MHLTHRHLAFMIGALVWAGAIVITVVVFRQMMGNSETFWIAVLLVVGPWAFAPINYLYRHRMDHRESTRAPRPF